MILKRPAIVLDKHPRGESFQAVATYIPIRTWRGVFKSFGLSKQVEKQLKQTPGIIAYSLAVNPLRKQFWTYSVWTDLSSMATFSKTEPHAGAAGLYDSLAAGGSAFVEWKTPDARLRWPEAFEHLKQPSFTRGAPGVAD